MNSTYAAANTASAPAKYIQWQSTGGGLSWAMGVTSGAWLATHLWTHYEFTADRQFLRTTGYPLLKQTAQFFLDYMVEDPRTHWLVTGPSISPENAFRLPDGREECLSMMPTIDRAVVYEIYRACIQASAILGIDAGFRARLQRDLQRLPPYRTGPDGALMEWNVDGARRSDPSHRHASHLLGLYPFGHITPEGTPALAQGCARFLDLQTGSDRWEDTEWTRGNLINFYARLHRGNDAYRSLTGLYRGFLRENLMTVSPAGIAGAADDIFSFDATEAAVAGMCEMLLQSHTDTLDVLPALPAQWPAGRVKGICARGGMVADIQWRNSRVTALTLYVPAARTVFCRINGQVRRLVLREGKNTVKV